MAQEYAIAFYKSKEWQKCRAAFVKSKGGLCEDCLRKGIYTPGKVVHHIQQITPENIYNPEVTLNFGNLRLVCQDCHAKEHTSRELRYSIDADGNVSPL